MESVINIGTFIQNLTYYIKIAIYVNKGTDQSNILEKCIKIYNKYKTIEMDASTAISEKNEAYVRKCLKRLNLVLKVDEKGNPIDIHDKNNQLKMVYLSGHESLDNNDMNSMIEYATTNKIYILTEIPLTFILRESKYQQLLWQYTRSLFYISQLLISRPKLDKTILSAFDIQKQKVFDHCAIKLEENLCTITDIEEKIKLNQILALDKFLNHKLIKINEKKVNDAKDEVKQIFKKKGISEENSMTKIIDSISEKLTDTNLSRGNLLENMISIARNVADEMKGSLENNPQEFQSTLGAITDVIQDFMNDSSEENTIPPELKNIISTVIDSKNKNLDHLSEDEITKNLEQLIEANGINREEFMGAIKSQDGNIDVTKLEGYLQNFNKNNQN